ncbi:MAG TPA: sigma-70 family RNA polymerase sigma factor [Planctomycetota bacterium]|nr:sigma-70 family RNA polymerase sigma factor [Planctomycetota bacterium]
MPASDEQLFAAYRDEGDESALRALVDRHWAGVYRLAHAIVRDAQAAEDAAQEALVRVVQAARARKVLDPFESWLRTVTVNEARMSLRSRKRRERREEEAAAQPRQEGALDPAAVVREYADKLDEHLRLPIVLHYGLGLSHREVAETLGCPQGTASTRIREGVERLRALAGTSTPLQVEALAVIASQPVPPAPSVSVLVARAAATKAAFALPGKKLVWALLAFGLCAGGGGALVATRLLEEPPPARLDGTTASPSAGEVSHRQGGAPVVSAAAPDVTATNAVVFTGSDPTAFVRAMGGGEKRRILPGPGDGPGPTLVAKSDPVRLHVTGRVVDVSGSPVAGARVAVLAATKPRPFQGGMKFTKRAPPPGAQGAPAQGAPVFRSDDFKAMDAEIQQTMAVSRTLRGLGEVATGESGPDGTFALDATSPGGDLFIAASIDRGSEVLQGEKPLPGPDAGDIAIQHAPLVSVAVTAGGAPVVGATVQFMDGGGDETDVTTDASGLAHHATGVPRTLVTVAQRGYATCRALVLVAGKDQSLDLVLVPSASIAGVVRGPDGKPLGGVSLVAVDPDGPSAMALAMPNPPPLVTATTDQDGRYSLEGLVSGRVYEVTATPADATVLTGTEAATAPGATDFSLGAAGSVVATISMDPPSTDPRLNDWPGVMLERNEGGWRVFPCDRSVQGAVVTFGRLAPGTYRVVSHPLIFPEAATGPVTIATTGGPVTVTLALTQPRTITGRVVDASGNALPRARVLKMANGAFLAMIVQGDGRFSINGGPESVTFVVSAEGFQDRQMTAAPGVNDMGDVALTPAVADPASKH